MKQRQDKRLLILSLEMFTKNTSATIDKIAGKAKRMDDACEGVAKVK